MSRIAVRIVPRLPASIAANAPLTVTRSGRDFELGYDVNAVQTGTPTANDVFLGQTPTGELFRTTYSGMTGDFVTTTDPRLSDQRVPTDASVTLAKMASIPGDTILGRQSTTGTPQALTPAEARIVMQALPVANPSFTGTLTGAGVSVRHEATTVDLNSFTAVDRFTATDPTNAPVAGGSRTWLVEVFNSPVDADSVTQRATLIEGGGTISSHNRRRTFAGAWEAWTPVGVVGPSVTVTAFASRAAATAATIDSTITHVILNGWAAAGDAPPAHYVKVGAQPSFPGKFQSADGAWWALESLFVVPEHFGAVASTAASPINATPGVSDWLEHLQSTDALGIILPRRGYWLAAALPDITRPLSILGAGSTSCGFIRNHTGTAARGLFHFRPNGADNPNGSQLKGFFINMAAGTTAGGHISGVSDASTALGSLSFEDLYLTTFGTNTNDFVIRFDGQLKTTGALGCRSISFVNCVVFGANGYSMALISCDGFSFVGGGFYAAGSNNISSGGIQVTGTAGVPSTGVKILSQTCTGLNLTRLNQARFQFESIGAISGLSVANDATCTATIVEVGAMTGTVTANWVNSGVRRHGAAWSAT